MNLTVNNERDNTTMNINFTGTSVQDLLKHLQINKEAVLVIRNNEVITEDELLQNNDVIELLSVISGG